MTAYATDYSDFQRDSETGTRTASIVYYVNTIALANPLLDPSVPAYNSVHPWDDGCKVDRLQAQPIDATGTNWKVTALYSSDRRFSFPTNQDTTTPLTKTLANSFVPSTVTLPFLYTKYIVTANPGSGFFGSSTPTYVTTEVWDRQDMHQTIYLENAQVKVTLTDYTPAMRKYIKTQQNKFHYLEQTPAKKRWSSLLYYDGSLGAGVTPSFVTYDFYEIWQFNGADIVQTGPRSWQATYSWTRDSGNDTGFGTGLPGAGNSAGTVKPGVRPPFHKYLVVPYKPTYSNGLLIDSDAYIAITPIYSGQAQNLVSQIPSGDITGYAGASQLPGNPV